MNELQLYLQDDFIEFKRFESKDLSYSVFKDVDFHKYIHLVSFFRSDFRGSKFTNVEFYKNNFDRSDFLSTVFLDCSFEKVQFGCCQIKNCYFKNVKFINNFYRNTSIHSTTFVNCEFPDESFLINMQHCKLINCTFTGCTFEMSTTDSDMFECCKFYNTNLATMHAENHKFVDCQFDNVCLGSSYFFGYSIANCSWNQVVFLYRGEHVNINNLLIDEVLEKFEVEHRYNDILNFYISSKLQEKIPEMLRKSFKYFEEKPFGRMLEISLIIESLSFAAIYETIDYEIIYESLIIIEDIDMSNYSFDERIEITSLCTKLQNALYLKDHSEEYLAKINVNSISTLSIKINNDDYDTCNEAARNILASISDESYWTLIEKQKGSWTLIYSAATVIVLAALPKIIKNYADVYFDIKTKKVLSDKLLQKLQATDISLKDIKKLVVTTQEAELLLPAGQCMNENLLKSVSDVTVAAITANM